MLDFTRFQILTFDCYGTLIDWETGIFSALRPVLAAHGKIISDFLLLEMYSELEAKAEQGEFLTYCEVLQSVVRGFGERLGFVPTEAEVRSLPDSVGNWQPFADTVAALRRLKSHYHDVIPAKSLGIATVWVNRPSPRPGAGAARAASGQPDLQVPNLSTLANLATQGRG